jgi:hypothetical protein
MTPGDLLAAFRSAMGDEVRPRLWTDDEVWEYLNDAYFMFVRLTGGIADFGSPDSPWCSAEVFSGEPASPLHPSLLRITNAHLRSTGRPLEIVNYTQLMTRGYDDYGERLPARLDDKRGPVRTMVIGMRKHTARWVAVPEADDVVDLWVYRLPLKPLNAKSEHLHEVEPLHHPHLLEWMKHRAYGKKDADGFDEPASLRARTLFEGYCTQVRAELERAAYKPRTVSYGGV